MSESMGRCCCCGTEKPKKQMFKLTIDPSLCTETCEPGQLLCAECARRGFKPK